MKPLAAWIVHHRKSLLVLFGVLVIISILMLPFVGTNYQLSKYLPDHMNTKKGLSIYEDEFRLSGSAHLMIENVSIPEALSYKERLLSVDGVKNIIWLDDMVDLTQPIEFLDSDLVRNYYVESAALFTIEFTEDDYSSLTRKALNEISRISGTHSALSGTAVANKALVDNSTTQTLLITLAVMPIFIFILIFATHSWFEPIIFMLTIGVSVILNMGTNLIFGEISFITLMVAALLQFAISMDYAIFLLHKFADERNKGAEVEDAMRRAIHKSIRSISASALTTVAGFVAFMFMRYEIGLDLGLVLAKGIILSLISVVLLLPPLTIYSARIIEKTHHRSFLPSFEGLGKSIVKTRYGILLVLLLSVPAFLGQSANTFLYGEDSVAASEGSQAALDRAKIQEKFGMNNILLLLVPKGDIPKETSLANDLENIPYMKNVQAIVTLADSTIPRAILPQELIDQFESNTYSRMLLTLDTKTESPEATLASKAILSTLQDYYGNEFVILGSSISVDEIKEVVESDYIKVNLISILAVGFILLITFRSFSLPIILVFVIQASIWLNMSIPYFMGENLVFIGYIIISAIQLGATIDYAILLTDNYLYTRQKENKKEAIIKAITQSGPSIFTSALILGSSGFAMYFISTIEGISQLGILVGRGALLSALFVLTALPWLLIILDKMILKTTLRNFKED